MTEQLQKKRKRRQLLLRISNPNEKEIHRDIDALTNKLFKIFKYHIGKANAINSYDLFKEIFNCNPFDIDVYQREYLWNVVKNILMKLRSQGTLFIVSISQMHYVLQTKEEATEFKNRIDRMVKALNDVKDKADRWVEHENWRNIL